MDKRVRQEKDPELSTKTAPAQDVVNVKKQPEPELKTNVPASKDVLNIAQEKEALLDTKTQPAGDVLNVARETLPQLGASINAAPDGGDGIKVGAPLMPVPLRGGAITVKETANLKMGQFSMVQNMRGRHPGFEQRGGQRKLHDTADGTNKVVSIFQFNKAKVSDDHFLALFSDGDVLEATNAPPGVATGAVFGTELWSGTTSPEPSSQAIIDDMLIVSNGVDQHQIYAGDGSYVKKFVVYRSNGAPPTVPTVGEDFSVEINDGQSSTVAVLDSLDTYANNECVFICTPVPANSLAWTVSAANGTVSTATLYYKKNDNTWADTSMTDGTKSGTTTLAQTGSMTWTLPTDEQSSFMYGRCGFWYQLRVSVQLDSEVEISGVTFGAPFQDLRNIWNGIPVDAVEVQVEGTTQYSRYAAGSVDLDALASGKKIYIAASDRIEGIYIDPGSTPNATGTSVTSLKYWNGNSFVTVGTVTDGTSGMSNPGWITFPRQTAYPRQFGTSKNYAYWYELIWDSTISDDVTVYIRTMPYFDIGDFGKVGVSCAVWKERLIVSFDFQPEYYYVSQKRNPMVFNGYDSTIQEAGDGRPNKIKAMRRFYDELMIFQEERGVDGGCLTLMVSQSSSTVGTLVLSTTFGTLSNKSVVVVDGIKTTRETNENPKTLAFFLSNYGVCMSDGTGTTIISDDIQNYFNPQESECIRTGYESEHWIGYDSAENILRLGLVSGGSATLPNIFPVYDLVDHVWYFDTPAQELSCMTEVTAGTGNVNVIQVGGGIDDGTVYQLNYGTNDVSTEIDGYITVELDSGGYEMVLDEVLLRTKVQSAGYVAVVASLNGVSQGVSFDGDPTNLTFVDGGGNSDTLTDSGSGFVTDGFTAGEPLIISGATTSANDGVYTISSVAAGTITVPTGSWDTGEAGAAGMTVESHPAKLMTAEASNEVIRRHRFTENYTDDHISLKIQNNIVSQSLYLENLALDLTVLRGR